jgi:hypothetical protein
MSLCSNVFRMVFLVTRTHMKPSTHHDDAGVYRQMSPFYLQIPITHRAVRKVPAMLEPFLGQHQIVVGFAMG